MLGERIKEERQRLNLNQTDFAALAGAAKRTLIDWEKGATSPSVLQLQELLYKGVDAVYILTGIRSTPEELANFQACQIGDYFVDGVRQDDEKLASLSINTAANRVINRERRQKQTKEEISHMIKNIHDDKTLDLVSDFIKFLIDKK